MNDVIERLYSLIKLDGVVITVRSGAPCSFVIVTAYYKKGDIVIRNQTALSKDDLMHDFVLNETINKCVSEFEQAIYDALA